MPFTIDQFLNVFRQYNLSVWPMQIMLLLMGLAVVFLGTRKPPISDKAIVFILAFLWLWMGSVYHLSFFTAINKAAWGFGALFILQAGLFISARKRLSFQFKRDVYGLSGAMLLLYALAIYPALGYAAGHVYPEAPTFGLPCPTTILTLGMLIWARQTAPGYLFVIPLLWSVIGFFAAISLGIKEDIGLFVAGVLTGILYFRQKRHRPASQNGLVSD